MSASKMPTFKPRSRKPSARLTAVVDLPTPPLPDATAMIEVTPGMPAGDGAPRGFGATTDGFPLLHRAGIDADGVNHLAVGDDDVGQRPGLGELLALRARDFGERGQNVVFHGRHADSLQARGQAVAAVDSLHRPSTGPVNAYPD